MMIFPAKIFRVALFTITLFTIPFLLTGCSAQQRKSNDSLSRALETDQTQYNEPPSPDHILGQIVQGPKRKQNSAISNSEQGASIEDGACQWLLRLDNDPSRLLDPVNLTEDFQKDGLKVWVLYAGMRRMNRCPEASPVWVRDIVLRQR